MDHPLVTLQGSQVRIVLLADVALEELSLLGMDEVDMVLEIAFALQPPLADVALEPLHQSHVLFDVPIEALLGPELLAAGVANHYPVRIGVHVDYVRLESLLAGQQFVALRTLELLMALHVLHQSKLPRERLRAEIALERALIFAGVHIERVNVQRFLVLVLLPALLASERIRIGVESEVFQQRPAFEEFLVAARYVPDAAFVYPSEMAVQQVEVRCRGSAKLTNHPEVRVQQFIFPVDLLLRSAGWFLRLLRLLVFRLGVFGFSFPRSTSPLGAGRWWLLFPRRRLNRRILLTDDCGGVLFLGWELRFQCA